MNDLAQSDVEFVEEPDTEEISPVTAAQISQIVLNATDWTTETILSQYDRGNIDIKPRFQRRDAWTIKKKSQFIESIILGLPIPQIVLAERKGERGRYIVLDGKQRLLTLLQFTGKFEGKYNEFKLSDLAIRSDLKGKKFEDFNTNTILQNDSNSFYNQTIRTIVIRNWPNTAFLHVVFLRLNTGSVSLSPQELRQALFPGEFMNYIDDKASENMFLRKLLGNKEPDFRMRDVEIFIRYLAFAYFLPSYAGNMSLFLDQACEKLNLSWETTQDDIIEKANSFSKAMETAEMIFGTENVGKKWITNGFERRLNRAVLDTLLFYFSNPSIQTIAIEQKSNVMSAFKDLCQTSEEFRNAIELSTKSMKATYDRLSLWGVALRDALAINFEIPTFDNERKRINFGN